VFIQLALLVQDLGVVLVIRPLVTPAIAAASIQAVSFRMVTLRLAPSEAQQSFPRRHQLPDRRRRQRHDLRLDQANAVTEDALLATVKVDGVEKARLSVKEVAVGNGALHGRS